MKKQIHLMIPVLALLILSGCLEPDTENIWSLDPAYTIETGGYCRHLDIAGDRLFIAAGQGGLQVWDITDFLDGSGDPQLLNHLRINSELPVHKDIRQVIYASNARQIIALETGERPLQIDYIRPANPIFTGQLMSEKTEQIHVIDDSLDFLLFAADEDDGIKISEFSGFFINDTTIIWSPNASDDIEYNVVGLPTGLSYHDSLIVLTREQLGVALYRFRGLGIAPLPINAIDTEGTAESATFHGDKGVFVASGDGGCYYFSLSGDSLTLAHNSAHFAKDLRVEHCAYEDEVLALALGSRGLALYDISEPTDPQSRGVHDIGYVYTTTFHNGLLYAATREGLQIFHIEK